MRKARAFFFVCLGILCLVAAYHFGATSATAQSPGNPVVGITNTSSFIAAVTANGDVYLSRTDWGDGPWTLKSNVFSGPVSAQTMSMGQLKVKYATPAAGK